MSARVAWIGLGVGLCVIGVVAALTISALDPENLKPRVIAAAERATGRTLTISGKVGIKLSLVPTISMEGVALSAPPGASRPEMVKVARVELSFALLPLLQHRFEIDRISLQRPDIQIETNQAGIPDWTFSRAPPPPPPAGEAQPKEPTGDRFAVVIKQVEVVGGRLAWLDGRTNRHLDMEIPQLTVASPTPELAQVAGTVIFDGRTIGLTGRTSPPRDPADAAVWPVELKLASGGANLSLDGQIAHPLEGKGYRFSVDAVVPDPADFAAWFPRLRLASLHAVTAHADIGDGDGLRLQPAVSALSVKVGAIDLGAFRAAARLEDVGLSARGVEPLKVSARVVVSGSDWGITGNVGDLAWLNGRAIGPVAVDLELNAASARASVKGTIQTPKRFAGYALDIAANVPNPSLVVEGAPPTLKSVVFQTRLTDTTEPVPFQLSSSAGDLAGELSISRNPKLSVEGRVSSHHLDLDALRTPPTTEVSAAARAASPTPFATDPTTPLFSDKSLKFEQLRGTDAGVTFALDQVRLGGTDLGAVNGALSLKDGVLRLDPFAVGAPDQHRSGTLVVDAAETPPRLHLTLNAPGVALRPLLVVLGFPQFANGTADIHADLTGTGDSRRAIAASLDGWAGLAVEHGQLDAAMVNAWLDQLQSLHINAADRTDLRCFAMRAEAKSGVVTVEPSALNTAALILEGSGEVNLADETMSLRLRPRTTIGKTGIALPVRVSGKMRAPSAKIDISPTGMGGGPLAGLLLGGTDLMGAAGGGDPCAAALARARDATPGSKE